VLLYIGRTFNNYYLVWPAMGAAIAALVWAGEARSQGAGLASTGADSQQRARPGTAPPA